MHIIIIGELYENIAAQKCSSFSLLSIFLSVLFSSIFQRLTRSSVRLSARSFARSWLLRSTVLVHHFSVVFLHTYKFFERCSPWEFTFYTFALQNTQKLRAVFLLFLYSLCCCCCCVVAFACRLFHNFNQLIFSNNGNRNRFPFFIKKFTVDVEYFLSVFYLFEGDYRFISTIGSRLSIAGTKMESQFHEVEQKELNKCMHNPRIVAMWITRR